MSKQTAPEYLSETAQEWYERAVTEFGLETSGELAVLAEAASSMDRIAECRELIKRDGLVIEGSRGLVSHPATRMEQQHRGLVLQACRQLGISSPVES
ncbi:hypothetical protein CK501_05735 [Halovibrio salipaludis]|uniref:Phage terminase small subunit P27 family n=1 Tax=Halovibrio salipaludis TaxID=2032626 RepID=A0A2A2F919_9GAMM|nr:hypothetical protein CK501_05735 [Halovibrio salipaludis]